MNIPAILNATERVIILGFVGVLGSLNTIVVDAICLHADGKLTAEAVANLTVDPFGSAFVETFGAATAATQPT